MIGVLKMEGFDMSHVSAGEIRRYFKDNGARPEDIHMCYNKKDSRDGCVFLIFTDKRELDVATQADGTMYKGRRLLVVQSNPQEFNKYFPGLPMLTRQANEKKQETVLKIENLEPKTMPSDIRKHLREIGLRPEEIHLVPGGHPNRHSGVAFIVFSNRREGMSALQADGSMLRGHKMTVLTSNPAEFNQCFPGVPMISKPGDFARQNLEAPRLTFEGILKLDGLDLSTKPGDIRKYFRENGARPADIHLILGPNGRHEGSALLVFTEKKELETALQADGTYFRDKRLSMRKSNAKEFNRFFPGMPILSSKATSSGTRNERNERNGRDSYHNERNDRHRDRSRSPIRASREDRRDRNFYQNFGLSPPRGNQNIPSDYGDEKFIRMSGLDYAANVTQIVNFFHPIPVQDVFFMKHPGGKFAGKQNGEAVVEFFDKNAAQQALQEWNGRFINQRIINLRPAAKDDIAQVKQPPAVADPVVPALPDVSVLEGLQNAGNPQLQNLVTLLTATVSAIASQNAQGQQPGDRERDDSIISRVASSANIDVTDIKNGRVVGLRNLPYSVSPDQILHFFHGFHCIADSVRIHYLEDGRCSGDAIISFRSNRDAKNAVSSLNRKSIGHRRIELFFL